MAARASRDGAAPAASAVDPGAMRPQPYNNNNNNNNNADPDLAKCREGSNQPWTIAGCYDLHAPAAAKPRDGIREQLRRALAGGNDDIGDDAAPEPPAQVATAPRVAAPQPAATQAATPESNSPWAKGPWRTSDERACRDAGGMLVKPSASDDLTGIPQVVLDNPEVPRAQLAATPYCKQFGMTDSAENERLIRGLVDRTSDAMRENK
jgi:hypothetical protein